MPQTSNEIVVDFWGDFACFTRPENKVERLTYPVPTPSAVRGMLSAIYSKPAEFYWQVRKIEVLSPIGYMSVKRNEVKNKVQIGKLEAMRKAPPIVVVDATGEAAKGRTQRQSVILLNPHYRIHAVICKNDRYPGSVKGLYAQAVRRIQQGQCFHQPYFGTREFSAYFALGEAPVDPIPETLDVGLTVYDVFDLIDSVGKDANCPDVSLYHCRMENGVINVPDYLDGAVLKGGAHFA